MNAGERWLKLLLRVEGACMLLAIVPAIMPRGWIAAVHRWVGLGGLRPGILVEYLARTLSTFFAATGGLLLLVSRDVRKHAGLIRYLAGAFIVLAAIVVGTLLPHRTSVFYWLAAADAAVAAALGVVWLVLLARLDTHPAGAGSVGPHPDS